MLYLQILTLWGLIAASKIAEATVFKVEMVSPAEQATESSTGVSVVTFRKPADSEPLSPKTLDTISPITSDPFVAQGPLKARVDFWIQIYSKYESTQGVIHDSKYLDIVYEAVDFKDLKSERQINQRIKTAKKRWESLLKSIHHKISRGSILSPEELQVKEQFKNINEPLKFLKAASSQRLRFQVGQKDRFLQGLIHSGRYLSEMEKIFKEKGLPIELTRLPFVESSFNVKARSKVGASGVWQFMPSTAKLYMRITDTVDERNDPMRATEAAAQFMASNFAALGSWPLAITAYNHGTLGVIRAVRHSKSRDLVDIIERYRSPSFGFASSNFYCEFLAALEVERNASHYFGKFEKDKPLSFAEFIMTNFIDIKDLSDFSKIPIEKIHEYNPSLTEAVLNSERFIPAGFPLRIPYEERNSFLVRYNEIPSYRKFSMQKVNSRRSIASTGTTRRSIARPAQR